MTPQDAARALIAHGLSVIPIVPSSESREKAPPAGFSWAEFQDRIPTTDEIERWFKDPKRGIAVLGGKASGNLEIIDVEDIAPIAELTALIDEHLPGLLATLPQVNTPSGGRHIFYRCETIAGNQKLAMRPKPSGESDKYKTTLIETRGIGGYVLTVSSPPECHPSGKTYTLANGSLTRIPQITAEQRDILLSCCRSFNRLIVEAHKPVQHQRERGEGKSPGDDYNARGDGLGVLLAHGWKISGWKISGRKNGSAYLRRPGKDSGISATYGHVAPGILNNFSSNAAPFDLGAFDNFGIFARLEAAGDFALAARLLRDQGYGEPVKPTTPPVQGAATPPNLGGQLSEKNGQLKNEPPIVPPLPETSDENVELIYSTMNPTEDNVARVFEDRFKNELRYCEAWGRWLRWNESKWETEHTLLAFHYCRELARKVNQTKGAASPAKASFSRGVESFCRASRTFATITGEWDRNAWLLNDPVQTTDLETMDSHAHVKTDYITKCTRLSPVPGPHPVFDMFMRDICLGDEGLIRYHQLSLGACLSGAIQDNFLLFWYGTGQNGKNTFGDLVTWILGDYAKVIPIETLISNKNSSHPTTLANLRGLRLAVCSEVSEGSYWDEARVKSLTGDTEISARFMRQDFFEFRRTHKHLVYGNHRPMLRIVDPGMQARLHIVPFKAHFPPDARDPEMRAKLEAEAPQILSWLIAGHEAWLEDGYLKKCSAVQAETDSYFESQSTNEAWLGECCIEGDGHSVSAKELYTSFKAWKEARGEGVISQTRWGEWIGQRGYAKGLSQGRVQYRGITLKAVSVLDFRA